MLWFAMQADQNTVKGQLQKNGAQISNQNVQKKLKIWLSAVFETIRGMEEAEGVSNWKHE